MLVPRIGRIDLESDVLNEINIVRHWVGYALVLIPIPSCFLCCMFLSMLDPVVIFSFKTLVC